MGANVYENDSAEGSFMCAILGIVQVQGQVTSGTVNPDGSVTLNGVGAGIDMILDEPFEDCPFEVTLRGGIPGDGGFTYNDCVVPPPGDDETVTKGHIFIH